MSTTTSPVIYATSARVGRTVAQLLGWKRATQKALAEHLGLPQSSVSDAIAGRRRWTVDELDATAQFLDVEIADLVNPDGPDPARLLAIRASRCIHAPQVEAYGEVVELFPKAS